MRHLDRPSVRFLGLLHGQAIIRHDADAQSLVEACAAERGQRAAVARHSFTYVRRMRELEMDSADLDESFEPDPAYLINQGAIPATSLSSAPHGRS